MSNRDRINWQALSSPVHEGPINPATAAAFEPKYTDKAGSAAITDLKRLAGVSDRSEQK